MFRQKSLMVIDCDITHGKQTIVYETLIYLIAIGKALNDSDHDTAGEAITEPKEAYELASILMNECLKLAEVISLSDTYDRHSFVLKDSSEKVIFVKCLDLYKKSFMIWRYYDDNEFGICLDVDEDGRPQLSYKDVPFKYPTEMREDELPLYTKGYYDDLREASTLKIFKYPKNTEGKHNFITPLIDLFELPNKVKDKTKIRDSIERLPNVDWYGFATVLYEELSKFVDIINDSLYDNYRFVLQDSYGRTIFVKYVPWTHAILTSRCRYSNSFYIYRNYEGNDQGYIWCQFDSTSLHIDRKVTLDYVTTGINEFVLPSEVNEKEREMFMCGQKVTIDESKDSCCNKSICSNFEVKGTCTTKSSCINFKAKDNNDTVDDEEEDTSYRDPSKILTVNLNDMYLDNIRSLLQDISIDIVHNRNIMKQSLPNIYNTRMTRKALYNLCEYLNHEKKFNKGPVKFSTKYKNISILKHKDTYIFFNDDYAELEGKLSLQVTKDSIFFSREVNGI